MWKKICGPHAPGSRRAPIIGSVLWYYGYCDVVIPSGASSADKAKLRKQRRWGWVPAIALKGTHRGAGG